ncbi:maleylpyruvate isomerase family mycothiol-dependent enzyme [Nocardia xishanensis]|uniref:maleylpyruvate isomerase family mycothiol-dependent enzyme n=1 Tax=Nocardia xishanensis TaxID=238964 RepID=UPI00341A499E
MWISSDAGSVHARASALRGEREALLQFCDDLDESDWQVPSRAIGWRVQDVVAHLGSGCKAAFTPALLTILRSSDIERTNDVFVDARRTWRFEKTLSEYVRWSRRVIALAGAIERTPAARLRLPLAELGRFPVGQLLAGAMVFDHHTHLRYDLAPALNRPAPPTDAPRMAIVLEWMFAILGNQLASARPSWLSHPLDIVLEGPGGGTWSIHPEPESAATAACTAATVTALACDFPDWGTRRSDWRRHDVRITGDESYACRFLDELNVV